MPRRKHPTWGKKQIDRAASWQENKGSKPPLVFRIKMSWTIALLSAAMVFVAIAVTSFVGYWVASRSLLSSAERTLEDQATELLSDQDFLHSLEKCELETDIRVSRLRNPGLYFMVVHPLHNQKGSEEGNGSLEVQRGSDHISLGQSDLDVIHGKTTYSQRKEHNRLILTTTTGINDWTLVLAQNLSSLQTMTSHMASVFAIMAGIGTLLAMLSGWAVARTSLVPVQLLIDGTERIARTDDLTPLPVYGSDELARLTESFNEMLKSLQESRERQSQLVADAGHELKTPLTSLRTNIELLMMASKNPSDTITPDDIADLEHDVMSQLEELTNLVTDLVDLAREDSQHSVVEPIDLGEILDGVIDRVRRRRLDIKFTFNLIDWYLMGDQRGLSRAFLNVLDNAAKWSPENGTVTMTMQQIDDDRVEITVDDEGPGIPADERELVFERFYRSVESRAMPGSGLGLAIVKQVMESHGGSVRVEESPRGGTRMVLELPGGPQITSNNNEAMRIS